MANAPMKRDVALRIGLAARELPETDAARLLRVLADAVGLPPTEKALSALTVQSLKSAANGELAGVDPAALTLALERLNGELPAGLDAQPETAAYAAGEMPHSIRVACASNTGEQLDGHFGSCERFLVYQVSVDEVRLVDVRPVDESAAEGDKNGYRTSLIDDCQLLFVASIGGPAAARVVRAGVHPIKKPDGGEARDELATLQSRIGPDAPPWLAKVMGQTPEDRIRFKQDGEEAVA